MALGLIVPASTQFTERFLVWARAEGARPTGVVYGRTRGEAAARLRVEHGPRAVIVQETDDWATALGIAGPLEATHEPVANCACVTCAMYAHVMCGHWSSRSDGGTGRRCLDCDGVIEHITYDVRMLTGVVTIKENVHALDGPAEFAVPNREGPLFANSVHDALVLAVELVGEPAAPAG